MGIIEKARNDFKRFTSDKNAFGVDIIFTAPNAKTATVAGLHTKHHLSVNGEGIPVNSKNAHISFSEGNFEGIDYPLRNSKGEVYLRGHVVEVEDSTGTLCKYVITEWFPDETTGHITCIIADHE